jgi:hypothetical protein
VAAKPKIATTRRINTTILTFRTLIPCPPFMYKTP